jgi:hypothetical protein
MLKAVLGHVRRQPVAYVALFVALGGTTYAATQLPANSVGTKQLKNGAVTSAKVRPHTLTGKNINLKKLGKVPSASHADQATHASTADNAANAAKLGGSSPGAFLASSAIQRIDLHQSGCLTTTNTGCDVRAFSIDGFTAEATCSSAGSGTQVVKITQAPAGSTGGDFGVLSPSTAKADPNSTFASLPWTIISSSGSGGNGHPFGGSFVLRSPTSTVVLTVISEMNHKATTACDLYGDAVAI